ncbi:MAG: peptidylprolyl isomerase [Acidobacteria bacterium]|nr:peptidylprolyl isomerase [Acidobacteriota bacterium]
MKRNSLYYTAATTLALSLLLAAGCKKSDPANVAASVNDRPVTYSELDKTYQSQLAGATPDTSEDQVNMQKLELLRSMIDSEIMLQRAEKLGLMATDADVEAKFNELKAPYTKEEFQRQLDSRKMSVEDLKTQLRRDLSVQKLFNKEITSHITITDADVANFYKANKGSFNFAEPQVHIAQIVVTPLPDPNVRNLKNSKAQNEDQAKQKIQTIAALLKTQDFTTVAQNYSEDPNSAANGGDLGFVPESAFEKANPELRKMVMSLQPGGLSPIIHTQEGYRILKVISKEPAGQRELTDPRVQQTIRETLLNRKDQLLKAAYYEVARNDTKVVNYLARRLAEVTTKSK